RKRFRNASVARLSCLCSLWSRDNRESLHAYPPSSKVPVWWCYQNLSCPPTRRDGKEGTREVQFRRMHPRQHAVLAQAADILSARCRTTSTCCSRALCYC